MAFDNFKFVELTQPLNPNIPTWNGSCGFCTEIKKDYDREFRVQQLKLHAGVGTHMDAPSHRFCGASNIADISLDKLIAPAAIIDVRDKAQADYIISVEDIENYERKYGLISQNTLVIGFTGWSRYWNDAKAYRNVDDQGQMHFPAFSAKAAELLLKRGVVGIAIDTLSPDCLDKEFSVHKLLLGAGKYIIENIGDCSQMPQKGGYVIALPLRAEGCTESPIRIIGLYE